MSLTRDDMLRELELLPAWRLREVPRVAAAEHAAEKTDGHLLQGTHDRGYLPHLKAADGIYFVTFRLADSLPAAVLAQWESLPENEKNSEIETWLDAGHGACWLGQQQVAEMVREVLLRQQNTHYRLHAWAIMPNHVHLVVEPLAGHALSEILQTIKSVSAHAANVFLQRSGEFWQRESYDHLIRGDDDMARCCTYARQNPVTAGLAASPEEYRYCDAYAETPAGEGACATEMPATPTVTLGQERRAAIMQMDWQDLRECVSHCRSCALSETRTQTVFGTGDERAEWLFVGEAPGEEEDLQGEPFVGPAGRLLDNMLAAIALRRGQNVYIANVLKCRPPENRDPRGEEVTRCDPFLKRQVELIQPRLIVALGKFAAQALLGGEQPVAAMRGRLHDGHGVPVIVTYHPAYLLRSLPDKAQAWKDLCFARATMRDLKSGSAAAS